MPARRFFVEGVRELGERVEICGSDASKILRVLRLRDGDGIEVIDSSGALFAARIAIAGSIVTATLEAAIAGDDATELTWRVDVAQALPKGQKMEFVVEKATELGACTILPFRAERSIAHRVGDAKLVRWRRLAAAAAAQSGRRSIPEVSQVVSFDALLARFAEYQSVLFAWELATHEPLRERLPKLLRGARCVLIVVGPEGGFTHDEAEAAAAHGAALLWLGPRILRTETAALALLAIVGALGPELVPSAS
jgi:16S rRNA (uracil1498-N3)-methyltransferase